MCSEVYKTLYQATLYESHIKGGYFWIHNGISGWEDFKVVTCKVVFILKAFK